MSRCQNACLRFFGAALISCATVVPAAAVDANLAALAPGDTVPLTIVPEGVFLRVPDDPTDEVWERVPEYQVQVAPAPAVHASVTLRQAEPMLPVPLYFSVISDRSRVYVKLRWVDATPDTETTVDRFRDGAAVQFALGGGESTSHMMGSTEQPVNIWYWRADSGRAENLAAGGFGSTTLLDKQVVTANAAYGTAEATEANEWTVVLSRSLGEGGEYLVDFTPGVAQPLAFAVWDGHDGQRDGDKRASTGWIKVDLAPLSGG
jgi:dimethylsulfide dehydrogenase subunit gamma/complex iron-sulfur molybdoenzyme family reductase subunit gamma